MQYPVFIDSELKTPPQNMFQGQKWRIGGVEALDAANVFLLYFCIFVFSENYLVFMFQGQRR